MLMANLKLASIVSSHQPSQLGSLHQSSRQLASCGTWCTCWGLDLDGEGPRVDGELGLGVNGVFSAAFTAGVSTTVFSPTYFL